MGKKIFYLLFLLLSLSLSLSSCILLGSLGSITGTVTEAGSGNPIVGATVLTVPETESKITDDNGEFTLEGIDDGTYTVTATALGYDSASVSVIVDSGGRAEADIKLSLATSIFSGTVKRGDDETPLKDIKVTVKTGSSSTQEYNVTSAIDGTFSFRGSDIPEGEWNPYWSFVDVDGYEYQRALVFLREATSNATFDFRLYPNTVNATISGSVVDFAGNPVTFPSVSFTPQFLVTRDISTEAGVQTIVRVDRTDQVTYNLNGSYSIAKLAGGSQYTVAVVAASYLSSEATVAFSSGIINVTHDFTLKLALGLINPIPDGSVTSPPVFEWQVAAGVDHYRLRVASGPIEVDGSGTASTSGTFLWESPNTSPAAGASSESLTYGGTTQLVSGGTYYWQVFAYNGADEVIGHSPTSWRFKIE